jgi:hypothetical protein
MKGLAEEKKKNDLALMHSHSQYGYVMEYTR